MNRYYSYRLSDDRWNWLKILVLAGAVIADVYLLIVMIGAFAIGQWQVAAIHLAALIGVQTLRIGATFLTKDYEYEFRDGVLKISLVFPMYRKTVIECSRDTIRSLTPCTRESAPRGVLQYTANACGRTWYVIKLSDAKKRCAALDDYIAAQLLGG